MSIYVPSLSAKDQTIVFDDERLAHEGVVWWISGKARIEDGKIKVKVYRMHGSVNHMNEFNDALALFAADLDMRRMSWVAA